MPWDLACERNWLSAEQLALTARQKSAEGIVGERGLLAEGPNGSPKGVEREEKLLAKERRHCIRRVHGAQAWWLG